MLYNINPKKWGESYWKMSHYITLAYPNNPSSEDKTVVKIHFENLKHLLPCENCRSHYSQNLKSNPLTDEILSSKYQLIKWLIDLHNSVNRRNGKKEYTIDEVIEMYLNENKQQTLFDINPMILQIIFLIIVIIGLVLYVKNKSD